MSLKYGLNIQKKPAAAAPRKALFDADEDEPELPPTGGNHAKRPHAQFGNLSTSSKISSKLEVDASVYDYDAAYDAMHAKSSAKKAAEEEDAKQRKPRYMTNLIAAAEVRSRDQLRAKDKLLQKEREAEGDEFADKEKFVTDAYKQQQEEVRRLEEEEKKKEEEEARKKRGKGMAGFYRGVMEEEERRHAESMKAAEEMGNAGISEKTHEYAPKEKSEADIAKELNAKGGKVIINEDGQVADKRQLLTAGLNVSAKPKPAVAANASRSTATGPAHYSKSAVQRGVRERQSRMLEEQLEQATKRAADEEADERRKQEHAAKSKKSKTDIEAARQRLLQRKQEAAAAKGS